MDVQAQTKTAAQSQEHEHGPLFLLDGNNIAYRAFYALPDTIATTTGFPTNALYGFCLMILKILMEHRPEVVIVAWDSGEKTFRHEEFVQYKAQRKPMPELLQEQWPYFEELSSAFGFINISLPGHEADDLLATLARQADREARRVVIVTGDRDALQLVSDHTTVMANTKGVTEVRLYDPQGVRERYGVPPALIPDLIGLKGDVSDNIPGVPGIGEKTASQLLCTYGSLEGVFEHLDHIGGPKRRMLLEENRELALLSKRLATLDVEAPIEIHATEVVAHPVDHERLKELFLRFEFATLLDRLPEALPEQQAPTVEPTVETETIQPHELEHALDWHLPVAVAAENAIRSRIWLAQRATGIAGVRVRELRDFQGLEGPLRTLLSRGKTICHDFKGSPLLHGLLERAGHDTYLAAYLLAPGRRSYPLDELLTEAGLSQLSSPEEAGPGAALAAGSLLLSDRQEEALRKQRMWDLFHDVELPLTRVLLDMETVGIRLDCAHLGRIRAETHAQMDELESRIYQLAGGEFNLGSTQQLGQILFEKLGLPRQRKTKTGYSTDAKTLETLRGSHEIVDLLEQHRELSKLLSTYLKALPQAVDENGRLHSTFHQTITTTGRLSSSDPNLQNIPIRTALGARIRECFIADPGHVLVVADYSQIELRIMAYLSQEPELLEAFRRGEDIHAHTAAEVFGLDPAAVTPLQRRHAKAVNFGIIYGISAFGLSQQLGIEREEAGNYISQYFERMPRVRAFIDATVADARTRGYVSTIMGRRRPIPEIRSENYQTRSLGERLAVNSVIQGSAADIIKVAMIRCHEHLKRAFPGTALVLQIHDELIFEAPERDAQEVRAAVEAEMVAAYPVEPPLQVDAGIGQNWFAAK